MERDIFPPDIHAVAKISTHTLTWSVTWQFSSIKQIIIFQLTRSRGAWLINVRYCSQLVYFNSHAHVERDFFADKTTLKGVNFNSHAHVERDRVEISIYTAIWYFNSHAHVERDWGKCEQIVKSHISTHTLTWSVTKHPRTRIKSSGISTHTLTWSVTLSNMKQALNNQFQLTRSRGAWLDLSSFNTSNVTFQLTRSRGAWLLLSE